LTSPYKGRMALPLGKKKNEKNHHGSYPKRSRTYSQKKAPQALPKKGAKKGKQNKTLGANL